MKPSGDAGEALLPWWAYSGSLNGGEDAELARRRAKTAEITPAKKGQPMSAGSALVEGAKKAASLVANNQHVRNTVSTYVERATGKKMDFSDTNAVTALVQKGPAPAAVVLRAAVKAGINPDDIFEGVVLNEQRDRATAAIVEQLRTLYSQVAGKLDGQASIHPSGSIAAALLNKEILLFARRQFGSGAAIREAHAKLRAFISMDSQTLEETIALHG